MVGERWTSGRCRRTTGSPAAADGERGVVPDGGRWYDPYLNPFLSRIVSSQILANPQNLNRYSYSLVTSQVSGS